MRLLSSIIFAAAVVVFTFPVHAADYKCKGNNVVKSGSTKYKVRTSGSNFSISKSGSTKGKARKSGSGYNVTSSGSTLAKIKNGKIYKSGSTWAKVSDAQRVYDCPPTIAATLWVLDKSGKL